MVRHIIVQVKRQHTDEVHGPNAETEAEGASYDPPESRGVFRLFQTTANIDSDTGSEGGNSDGKNDEWEVI